MKLTASQNGLLGTYMQGRTNPDPRKLEQMADQILHVPGAKLRKDVEYSFLNQSQLRERRAIERPSTGDLEHYYSNWDCRTGFQRREVQDPGRKKLREARRPQESIRSKKRRSA